MVGPQTVSTPGMPCRYCFANHSNLSNRHTEFLELVITKYEPSLGQANFKRDLKVLGRMIQWHVVETDEIANLRDKLRRGLDVILLIQSQLQGYVYKGLVEIPYPPTTLG